MIPDSSLEGRMELVLGEVLGAAPETPGKTKEILGEGAALRLDPPKHPPEDIDMLAEGASDRVEKEGDGANERALPKVGTEAIDGLVAGTRERVE